MLRCLALLIVILLFSQSAAFGKDCVPTQMTMGFFDLALIKASYPDSDPDWFKEEKQLNKQLELLDKSTTNSPTKQAVIDAKLFSIKKRINEVKQAIGGHPTRAMRVINYAVCLVGKEKNLDLVVDLASVGWGESFLRAHGEDISDEVMLKVKELHSRLER